MEKEDLRKKILNNVDEYYNNFFNDNESFEKGKTFVPYARRVFSSEELKNGVEAVLDFWLTEGRFSKQFSDKIKNFVGVEHAILVNSGSSANLLALTALTSEKLGKRRIKKGDEIITVAAGFPTTITPIIQNSFIPVFVDVEIGSYNAVIEQIELAVTSKTKAIFIAHSLGNPFDVANVRAVCDKYNLWLIEDNCDALGSVYNNRKTGSFGDLSTFSFYPAHHITTGEGGCVATNNNELAKLVRSFRDWGRDCYCGTGKSNSCKERFSQQFGNLPFGYDHKYVFSHVGYNLKMTDIQAAIGCAQIEKIKEFVNKRIENFNYLYNGLSKYRNFFQLPKSLDNSIPSWFAFPITVISNNFKRDDLVSYLNDNKIDTRNFFGGNLLLHPAFLNIEHRAPFELSNTNFIMKNTFFIGVYPGLKQEHLQYIVNKIEDFIKMR